MSQVLGLQKDVLVMSRLVIKEDDQTTFGTTVCHLIYLQTIHQDMNGAFRHVICKWFAGQSACMLFIIINTKKVK